MPDIITMGELLIDFIPSEKDCKLKDVNQFTKAAGGAPANVAAALGRIGCSVGFIGKVGNDAFGDFLQETMEEQGVNTWQIIRTDKAMTTLAFVSLQADGERDFAFYRKPGADMLLKEEEIDLDYINSAKIFHFGTISLTDEPVSSTTKFLIKRAKENGALISFDPNIRLPLWNHNLEPLRQEYHDVLPDVDLLKFNLEELKQLYPEETGNPENQFSLDDLRKITVPILKQGPEYIIITDGGNGSYFISKNNSFHVKTKNIKAVDTTGAGDAFMAGILSKILENNDLEKTDWRAALKRANKFGAITCSRYGAIPALPDRDDLE